LKLKVGLSYYFPLSAGSVHMPILPENVQFQRQQTFAHQEDTHGAVGGEQTGQNDGEHQLEMNFTG
jgi:hypothetical protein